jgi:hypothetical protein
MNANYSTINTKGFLLTNVMGKIDLKASINIFAGVMQLLKTKHQYRVLVDARDSKTILSLPDIYRFLEQLSKYRELHNDKVAVLMGNQFNNDTARFFEVAAQGRGFNIRLFFEDFEGAVKWLMEKNASPNYIHFLKN